MDAHKKKVAKLKVTKTKPKKEKEEDSDSVKEKKPKKIENPAMEKALAKIRVLKKLADKNKSKSKLGVGDLSSSDSEGDWLSEEDDLYPEVKIPRKKVEKPKNK